MARKLELSAKGLKPFASNKAYRACAPATIAAEVQDPFLCSAMEQPCL